jgi:hypothetical protein
MQRHTAVDPALLFGISLGLSLVLWWPSLTGALNGNIDITSAGLRYLAALGLSWLGVFGIGTLVAGYGREAEPEPPPALPPGPIEYPLRRDGDAAADDAAAEAAMKTEAIANGATFEEPSAA